VSEFLVSVVIPVYNAEKFVERAIKSALAQAEVAEVIVVDDGFGDGAFDICAHMAAIEPKVKHIWHENRANHGAGAARNLGILHASYPYIAFLDADDYYLPNRFKHTKATFLNAPVIPPKNSHI